jgi:hypothetical protein
MAYALYPSASEGAVWHYFEGYNEWGAPLTVRIRKTPTTGFPSHPPPSPSQVRHLSLSLSVTSTNRGPKAPCLVYHRGPRLLLLGV